MIETTKFHDAPHAHTLGSVSEERAKRQSVAVHKERSIERLRIPKHGNVEQASSWELRSVRRSKSAFRLERTTVSCWISVPKSTRFPAVAFSIFECLGTTAVLAQGM